MISSPVSNFSLSEMHLGGNQGTTILYYKQAPRQIEYIQMNHVRHPPVLNVLPKSKMVNLPSAFWQ